jgi:dienelactone hydrolase/nitroreductase
MSTPMTEERARRLVEAVIEAPSSHNTQPWHVEIRGDTIELAADLRRRLPVNDPDDRELVISCGAALCNLRLRAAELGHATEVTTAPARRFRTPGTAAAGPLRPLARVTLRPPDGTTPVVASADAARLAAAIADRHTCRVELTEAPVDDDVVERLVEAAAAEGATLRLVRADEREPLASLVADADRRQFRDRAWRRELARWFHRRRVGDGLTMPVPAVPVAKAVVGHLDLGARTGAHDADLVRAAPVVAVLATDGDGPEDWLVAGQALERVLLEATAAGLQAGFSNQPCQVAALRAQLSSLLGVAHPQLVLRIGVAPWTPMPTPRRPLADVTAPVSEERSASMHEAGPSRQRTSPPAVAAATSGIAIAALVGWDGSPGWQAGRTAAVLLLTAASCHWAPRRAGVAVVAGAVAVVLGAAIGIPWLVRDGLHPRAVLAAVALVAGLVLWVSGLRRVARDRSPIRRSAAVAGAVVATLVAGWAVVPAVMATNVAPIHAGSAVPADVGLDATDVRFETSDGVELAAWYVPPTNGAALVVRHGAGSTRDDVLDHAAVLVRHGYGVLLTDARGHGASGGRAMDFGWYGDDDITAAVDYLATRPEVDPARIAVLGMSMGGEEAIGAAAADRRIAAVVAEGATGRSAEDRDWLSDEYGWRGALQHALDHVTYAVTDVLTAAAPPTALDDAVRAAAPRPMLIVAAGDVPDEVTVAERLADAAPGSVTTWTVDGAGHTAGLRTAPEQWEATVVAFLDDALLD